MAKQAIYSPEGNIVTFIETKASFWDTVVGASTTAVKNIKRAPARRKALNSFADHLLRDEYAAEVAEKLAKAEAKAAENQTKLDQIVAEATN